MELKIAENIKRFRRERGLTQEQLAEALGVTAGAVYKWENGHSIPEVPMLTELAAFFDSSVDVLLGYGWEKNGMGRAAEKIWDHVHARTFDEGIVYAEEALRKYPAAFDVVFAAAELYFISMTSQNEPHATRAIDLYRRALALMDQNENRQLTLERIKNAIASCYYHLGDLDRAIALMQENNVAGINDQPIGTLLSLREGREAEALPYLSAALYNSYATMFGTACGFANVYLVSKELDRAESLIRWALSLSDELRVPGVTTIIDKANVRAYTVLAALSMARGNREEALTRLRDAKTRAEAFDRAPEYHVNVGLTYYYGDGSEMGYDDLGKTAMDSIEQFITEGRAGACLAPLWEEILHENKNQ
ncbi:MAG: helix-turn-helix domain-containing protein [Clostridia bacterium]|nr:helix-turn-helix domain-containing protein [Clostridia bacterium]